MYEQTRRNFGGARGGSRGLRKGGEAKAPGCQRQRAGALQNCPPRYPHIVTSPFYFSILAVRYDGRSVPPLIAVLALDSQGLSRASLQIQRIKAGPRPAPTEPDMTQQAKYQRFAADGITAPLRHMVFRRIWLASLL